LSHERDNFKSPIRPPFKYPEPNQEVELLTTTGAIDLADFGNTNAEIAVVGSWHPSPRTVFRVVLKRPLPLGYKPPPQAKLTLDSPALAIDTIPTRVTTSQTVFGEGERQSQLECVLTGPAKQDSQPVTEVRAPVVNFTPRIGNAIFASHGTSSPVHTTWAGSLTLKAEQWVFDLHSPKDDGAIDQLYGHGITHTIRVTSAGPSPYKADTSLQEALSRMRLWMTFAQGAHCGPCWPIGFDESGNPVWRDLCTPRLDPYTRVPNWFTVLYAREQTSSFEMFYSAMEHSVWSKTLPRAVAWYAEANRTAHTNLERSIVLSQIALEGLAYSYCVDAHTLVRTQAFKKLDAHDQLRLMLSAAQIDIEIPSHMRRLVKFAAGHNYDGPQTIAEVRNAIIHPIPKNNELQRIASEGESRRNVCELALQYVELAILHAI